MGACSLWQDGIKALAHTESSEVKAGVSALGEPVGPDEDGDLPVHPPSLMPAPARHNQ